MPSQSHETRTAAAERRETLFEPGLLDAARYMIDNPRQLETLGLFMSGEIHNQFGGSIVRQRGYMPSVVFLA